MKTVILGSPKADQGLVHHIEEEIKTYGYHVITISFPINEFKYKNLKDRLANTFRKTILKDKAYKRYLKFKPYRKELEQTLANLQEADFALIIGTDIYPEFFIKEIRKKAKQMFCYQWDGLDVYPVSKRHIKYYDTFYVFDPDDLKYKKDYPNIKALPNFYFENITNSIISNHKRENKGDLYYLGSFVKKRYEDLLQMNKTFSALSLKRNIKIYLSPKKARTTSIDSDFQKITEVVTYKENLINIYQNRANLDLLNKHHKGLSFRPFESLAFERKLITTNAAIKKYDFYRPENIFVWGEDENLEDFMNTEYHKLPESIYQKYSFRNWLKNVLQEEDKIEIKLPE